MRPSTLYAIRYTLIIFLLINLIGCEAFVRKFTRKKNKDNLPREELVLVPEEYKNPLNNEEQYRQYYVFWKAWQDELIEALLQKKSYKKQVDCAKQALKNLESMRLLLKPAAQEKLNQYIARMKDLFADIENDIYCRNSEYYRSKAENIRRDILRDLSFPDIKGSIV